MAANISPLTVNNKMDNTITVTTGLSYGSGFAGFIAGLSLNDWLALGGLFFIALTYFTNLYFRLRDERRQERLFLLRLKRGQGDNE